MLGKMALKRESDTVNWFERIRGFARLFRRFIGMAADSYGWKVVASGKRIIGKGCAPLLTQLAWVPRNRLFESAIPDRSSVDGMLNCRAK